MECLMQQKWVRGVRRDPIWIVGGFINEGGGVLNSVDVVLGEDIEMTPLDDLDTMEEGVGDKK